MLTLEQIIELQGKGFSYEQLQTLNSMNITITSPEPVNAVNDAKPENAVNEAKPENAENEAGDIIGDLKNEIGALTDTIKAMQEANVKNAKAEPEKVESVEDIIKSFMVAS